MAGREPAVTPGATRRAAVLGSPIEHSLSPVLHRAAYVDLGLDWRYEAIECGEAGLADFVAGCGPEWVGLSLTMPLKRAVLPLLVEVSAVAELVGAANTLMFGSAGPTGHNTDVRGIVEALRGIGARPGPAVVLGAGATAASSVVALAELGCPLVRVHARRPEAADGLSEVAQRVGVALEVSGWPKRLPGRSEAAIVVSTLPADAATSLVGALPADPGALLDVSYAPWPPPLLAAWVAAGGSCVGGDEMLLHQAAAQVALMTGLRPDVEVMRRALRAELARRN